jgi:outer membrane protein TolC
MKRVSLVVFIILGWVVFAQGQLTLESCQEKARANFPLVRQFELIQRSTAYNLSNAGKGFLPQASIMARATYQSEVTQIPVNIPNFPIDPLSKDQYQVLAELNQVVWDGGMINSQKKLTEANAAIEVQQNEVELYQLRERVNQVFFGILLLDENLRQIEIFENELQTQHQRITAYIKNGLANATDLDVIQVEVLNTRQRKTELLETRSAYRQMLSALLGEDIQNDIHLEMPHSDFQAHSTAINRPEQRLFEAKQDLSLARNDMISAKNLPRLGVFLQGGYGKPGLNMLKNEFSPFYIGGVRLSWSLGGFYTQNNERQLIKIQNERIDIQKEGFLFTTRLEMTRQQGEVNKLQQLLINDHEIITLRNNIKKAAEVKLENGIISVSDLVREINAENLARQNKTLHEIQLIMAIHQLKWITNN